jgi:hypothetical protein
MEQMRAQRAASSVWTEELLRRIIGRIESRQRLLGAIEFFERGTPVELTERCGMSERVIPDAVAFFDGAAGDSGASRVAHFLAENEECRFQIVLGKAVEH